MTQKQRQPTLHGKLSTTSTQAQAFHNSSQLVAFNSSTQNFVNKLEIRLLSAADFPPLFQVYRTRAQNLPTGFAAGPPAELECCRLPVINNNYASSVHKLSIDL